MAGICENRVVAVTGAGRGIGRAEAIAFARHGAQVVVNNRSADRAHDTVAAITASGGQAVAHIGDVSDMAVAHDLLACAVKNFGRLDVLVNNAGIVRDRMLVNMSEAEWDEAVRVNLRGTFTTTQTCARYWRDRSRTEKVEATIINTTSASGLFGNVGQANYGASKAGIASLTLIAAAELARYGVTVNALSPAAATDMSAHLIPAALRNQNGFDPFAVENVAPLVVWLGSMAARGMTGRVFDIMGGRIAVVEGWHFGPQVDIGRQWTVEELDAAVPDLVAKARANATITGAAST
jgi:NAD(P)-dependent dehydrogenase (short-subunit alcohol dehydrogenase family)